MTPQFSDLHRSIANGFVSFKLDDMRDDLEFEIVNVLVLDGDVSPVLLMVYTFRNLLGLRESAIMLRTSTREIHI